jgi:hypothetical protein
MCQFITFGHVIVALFLVLIFIKNSENGEMNKVHGKIIFTQHGLSTQKL